MMDSHVKFHSTNGKRLILIAEFDAQNRAFLSETLQEQFELLFVETGGEAYRQLCTHSETVSLVLLDMALPDMRGLDALLRIRTNPALAHIPVIVMTSDKETEVESLNLGAIDYISLPYPPARVVLARVRRTIELSEDRDIIHFTERDHLTGLYNQEYFFRYAEQYDTYHTDKAMDAIVVDVNHFHMINEMYGKAYGDKVLKRIGEKVREIVKDSGGIVCRHEADIFYVYCPHRNDYTSLLDNASAGLSDEGHGRTHVRLRLGVYSEVDKTIDIERRFDRAKLAANTVRSNFTKAIAIYDSALHESELFEEHLLESFHDALKSRQFVVYYQPKFDIRQVEPVLTSAEALVRWKNPELGMITPNVFIPLFEMNGLIQELDHYVWHEVAAQLREWKNRLGFAVPVSVNVSRIDMYDEDFVENLQSLLSNYGLTSDEFLLEITESAYTEDSDQIIETVSKLREAGFKIEMDDFGSGYSSLNMISSLPIDALKLDMQFIKNAFKGRKDTRMLEVVFEIAESLMVPSIAEGVETAEQMFTLKAMGCGIVQGYYFSKPVPAIEFEAFLQARRQRSAGDALPDIKLAGSGRNTMIKMPHDRFTYEAMHDPMTGLYNQSAFEMLLRDADRNHIALLLASVDTVERINQDSAVRERALRRITQVLRRNFRSVDFICRINSEEFVIIMTRINSSLEQLVRDKVRRINQMLAEEDDLPATTLSVGIAFSDRRDPLGDIFYDADLTLQRLRATGQTGGCAVY